jgi:hypothetical protein
MKRLHLALPAQLFGLGRLQLLEPAQINEL